MEDGSAHANESLHLPCQASAKSGIAPNST